MSTDLPAGARGSPELPSSISDPSPALLDAAAEALAGARPVPYWLDAPAPAPAAGLDGDHDVDLAVVGGGLTGLWAAVQAVEVEPSRSVALVEGRRLGWAASGRNGGFCVASLTHGLGNGLARWPDELPTLQRLGQENLDGIEDAIRRYGIDCSFERTGELTVARAPWQVAELAELHGQARRLGEDGELLDGPATRALLDSPTFLGGLLSRSGAALVDPARLVWGLAAAVRRLGVGLYEDTRVTGMTDHGDRVELRTPSGRLRARRVLLATSAFPSPLRRVRPFVVPVWDHVLVTEPLTANQRAAIGWAGREGVGDAGNQFHYFRLTDDGRILWGGYDALYYYGSDLCARRSRNPATELALAIHFLQAFPQLTGIRFSHLWAGAIDTCTRFSAFWMPAMSGKLIGVQGFTGLGVGASRFAAAAGLDLLAGRETERTGLAMVRRPPVPFPPEPLRWAGIQATRRAIARADANDGRRGLWLRTLDRLGLGFDS
jgi:glycine/D-amino acid oxidase-like deaminating enzyme